MAARKSLQRSIEQFGASTGQILDQTG